MRAGRGEGAGADDVCTTDPSIFSFLSLNESGVADSKAAYTRIADGKSITREQVTRDSKRLAHAYTSKLGLQAGDRIAILSPNSCAYPMAVYAGFIAGVVLVPLNPAYCECQSWCIQTQSLTGAYF